MCPSPALRRLLGGPLTLEQCRETNDVVLAPLDATLGVEGLPQSATGQTALFSGINAAQIMGRHVTGLPGPRVRSVVESSNLFLNASEIGLAATFANAYSQSYMDSLTAGRRRPSVTTCAVNSAGLPLRGVADLEQGQAVSWDVIRDRFSEHLERQLPPVSAAVAGRHLAAIASQNHLSVYETFIPDLAGHQRLGFTAAEAIARIDGLIGGILESLDSATTLLMSSDHGNIEDASHRRHTRNPVPLLVVGPMAGCFANMTSILEVTPRILTVLGNQNSLDD